VGEGQVGMVPCSPDRQRISEGVGVEVEAVEWLRLLLPCCSLTQMMSAVQLWFEAHTVSTVAHGACMYTLSVLCHMGPACSLAWGLKGRWGPPVSQLLNSRRNLPRSLNCNKPQSQMLEIAPGSWLLVVVSVLLTEWLQC